MLSYHCEQMDKKFLVDLKAYLNTQKGLNTPVRRMLMCAEDIMKHAPDATWDTDRCPPQPACRHCGSYFVLGPDGWHCPKRKLHRFLHT